MKKSIVAFAVLGASAACACAQSSGTPDSAADTGIPGVEGAAAPAPRLGSAANEALAKSAPAVFTVERGSRPAPPREETANPQEQGSHLLGRPTYVGAAGDFGALSFGRQHTLDYLSTGDGTDASASRSGGGPALSLAGDGVRHVDSSTQYYRSTVRGVSAGAAYGVDRFDGSPAGRAWGLSVGFDVGPVTVRAAHQNRHVARVHLYDLAGNNMEARNSIIAANMRFGWGSAYAGYSVNRGWGSSPLFNPDNPYGAGVASTPSTDSRDVLMGVAVPVGRATTLLASFIHKNDRDLANRDANQLAIGASYAVSRRTDFYAAYSHIRLINGAGEALGAALARGAGNSAINIGMRHAF